VNAAHPDFKGQKIMTNNATSGGTAAGDRFDTVEALLARFPEVSEAELGELKHWFGKEASAFEVASLASKETLRPSYDRFRAEHIDRMSIRDLAVIGVTLAALGGLLAAGSWLG
jgi:hypothetical protein